MTARDPQKPWREQPAASPEEAGVQALLSSVRAPELGSDARRRVRARIAPRAPLGWLRGPALTAAILVGMAGAAAAATGIWEAMTEPPSPRSAGPVRRLPPAPSRPIEVPAVPPVQVATATSPSPPPEPGPSVAPRSERPTRPARHPHRSIETAPRAAPEIPQIEEEVRILDVASRSLERGAAEEALQEIAEYRRRFSKGALADEAQLIELSALAKLGRHDELRAILERLDLEHHARRRDLLDLRDRLHPVSSDEKWTRE